ncbi:hypothetical protein Sango_1739100 [Sesamum angolense]|uniref:Uncharacterized protein n=1 Tax=Sesamum angolense TaxID=2727404 RepID=A0AAE1WML5_9LAMI|nr:hypothetical protein Sango_1739100 [Sesamum angolense]
MKHDARGLVDKCVKCQKHATLIHQPVELLKCHAIAVSFLPMENGHSGTISTCNLAKKIPHSLHQLLHKMGMKDTRLVCRDAHKAKIHLVSHPQANGKVEVTNRILVQNIKKRRDKVGGNWVEVLTSVLWPYRTTPRGSTGESPLTLVYGAEAIIPA